MIKNISNLTALLILITPITSVADTSTFGFIDSYIAGSDNKIDHERPYFTQAVQNDEYRLNLATLGVSHDDNFFRAKLSGQFGDSVENNYSAEPEEFFRYIQESYLGIYIDDDTYLDAGTFLAHIGAESWLSKDNINYTRSFIAEFSPYYETGLRLNHKINDKWSAQILGVNGWQNTTDERHPALGTQLSYTENNLNLVSNTFLGKENYGERLFHNFIASKKFDNGASLTGSIDVGHQSDDSPAKGYWWGYSLMAKQEINQNLALNTRFESYSDPNQIIVSSFSGQGFEALGSSVGADVILFDGLLLRGEIKWLWSENEVFNDGSKPDKNNTMYVMSLSYFNQQTL